MKRAQNTERGSAPKRPRMKKKAEPEIASSLELLARYPDEYVLYEVLEYTRDARVARARLLGHGRDEEALLRKKLAYRRLHSNAILGFDLSNLHRSNETILIL